MKIFSLQSKTGLVAWSVGLGFLMNFLAEHLVVYKIPCGVDMDVEFCTVSGWPFVTGFFGSLIYYDLIKFLYNLVFWVLVVLIILSLIRYFKTKKV